jgi:hypothetical protein
MSFRRLRILLLLGVLAGVIGFNWLERFMVRGWRVPLDVQVIPINGDGSDQAAAAIRALKGRDFSDIDAFLEREVARYGVKQSPAIQVTLRPELKQQPPAPPRDGSVLKTVFWSLKMRWWVYRQSGEWLPQPGTIRLFLLYHAPQDGVALAHSLGLQKGLIGVVHVFADPASGAEQHRHRARVAARWARATNDAGDAAHPATPSPTCRNRCRVARLKSWRDVCWTRTAGR